MNGLDSWQIVKWILVVLVAAFIGQFGKSFAEFLIQRARKRTSPAGAGAGGTAGEKPEGETSDAGIAEQAHDAKAEKKALKTLAKLRKKGR